MFYHVTNVLNDKMGFSRDFSNSCTFVDIKNLGIEKGTQNYLNEFK